MGGGVTTMRSLIIRRRNSWTLHVDNCILPPILHVVRMSQVQRKQNVENDKHDLHTHGHQFSRLYCHLTQSGHQSNNKEWGRNTFDSKTNKIVQYWSVQILLQLVLGNLAPPQKKMKLKIVLYVPPIQYK